MNEMTTLEMDDFTKIEGIDQSVAEVLNNADVKSFAELASLSQETLSEMMSNAGESYSFRDTSTWPEQASLAAEGKWDELQAWQSELQGSPAVAGEEEE